MTHQLSISHWWNEMNYMSCANWIQYQNSFDWWWFAGDMNRKSNIFKKCWFVYTPWANTPKEFECMKYPTILVTTNEKYSKSVVAKNNYRISLCRTLAVDWHGVFWSLNHAVMSSQFARLILFLLFPHFQSFWTHESDECWPITLVFHLSH